MLPRVTKEKNKTQRQRCTKTWSGIQHVEGRRAEFVREEMFMSCQAPTRQARFRKANNKNNTKKRKNTFETFDLRASRQNLALSERLKDKNAEFKMF